MSSSKTIFLNILETTVQYIIVSKEYKQSYIYSEYKIQYQEKLSL